MHLALDWLIPLIIILVSIYQWWNNRKQSDQMDYPAPEPGSPDWDELIDSLGDKPQPEPVRAPAPPPVLVRPTPAPPARTAEQTGPTLRQRMEQLALDSTARTEGADRERNLHFNALQEKNTPPRTDYKIKTPQTSKWGTILKDRSALRQAVVINELLAPPVSLR
jgi:hypothetical protein